MDDSEQKKASKGERSPNYPFVTLQQALIRAQQLYDAERRSATPAVVISKHWGYSPKSSGGQQTLAALRSYGLVADEGKGSERRYRLSELGLRILLDKRPDSSERDALLREAARRPQIMTEIYEKWPENHPSDATLEHYLVLERGFNPSGAAQFSKIFKENESLAKVYGEGRQPLDDEGSEGLNPPPPTNIPLEKRPATVMVAAIAAATAPSGGSMASRSQVGSAVRVTKNCWMSIYADGAVTQEALDRLKGYIDFILPSYPTADELEKIDVVSEAQKSS